MNAIDIAIHFAKANADVIAKTTARRLYPGQAPQEATTPYVVFNLDGGADPQMLEGAGGYPEVRVVAECLGSSASEALDVGDAIHAALDNVVKATIAGIASDIDIYWQGFDITDPADAMALSRRSIHFYVRARAA